MTLIGKNLGDYRILAATRLGESGVVYKALHIRQRKTLALKILRPLDEGNPLHLQFQDDILRAAELNHPQIGRVFAIESLPTFTIVPMEFVYGQSLSERIASGPSPFDFVLRIALQAADALIFAHEVGVVHRRITSNTLLVSSDGHLKILDFGLTRLPEDLEQSETEAGSPLFSYQEPRRPPLSEISYLSPEQVRSADSDARSDLFSLGLILYELLLGEFLFLGDDPEECCRQILARDLPRLNKVRADASHSWTQVLSGLLEKEPTERYPTARELMSDLHLLKEGFLVERPGFRSKNFPITRRSFFRHFIGEKEA
ncbi:MAG: serine/threonine-protein kinase [Acidobacteriota bacterium]